MAIPSDPAAAAARASRSTPSPATASKGKEREQRSSGSDARATPASMRRQLASSYYSSGADDWEEASNDGNDEGEGEGSSKEKWRQMFDQSFNESRASSLGHASTATKLSKPPPVIDPQPQKQDDDGGDGHDGRARRRPHPANWRMSGMLAKSSSNTTLGRDATELIHGYLNFTARRGSAVRTFALPPSSIDGLSYDTLARILDLDRRIEDSSWAEKGSRKAKSRLKPASAASSAPSSYTSFLTGGRNREQPFIYIEHLVDPITPGERRTSRPYSKWSRLTPWPQDSLQGFLVADFFRRQVARGQWVNLVVKEKGQGPPTENEGFGPSGLSRIGKGLSRLSWGLGSLFNGLDSPLRSPGSPGTGAGGGEQQVKRQQYLQLKDNLLDSSEEGSRDTAASRVRDASNSKKDSPPASPTLPRWIRSVWPFGGGAVQADSQQRDDAATIKTAPPHRAVARAPDASEQDARELDLNAITAESAATAAAEAKAATNTTAPAPTDPTSSSPSRQRRRSLIVPDSLRQAYLEGKARLSLSGAKSPTGTVATDPTSDRPRSRPRLRQGLTHLGKAIVSPIAIALNLRSPSPRHHSTRRASSSSRDEDADSDDAFNRRERERLNKRGWLPPAAVAASTAAAGPQGAAKSLAKFVSFRSLTPSRTSSSEVTAATSASPSSSRDATAVLARGARGGGLPKSPLGQPRQQQQAAADRPAPGPLPPSALTNATTTPNTTSSSPLIPPTNRRLIERTDLSVRNWRPSVALPAPLPATATTSSPEQWQALAAQAQAQVAQVGPALTTTTTTSKTGSGSGSGRFGRKRRGSVKGKKGLLQQQNSGAATTSIARAFPSSSNIGGAPAPTDPDSPRRIPLNSTLEILNVVEALGTVHPSIDADADHHRPTSPSRTESAVVASWDVNRVGEIDDEMITTDDDDDDVEGRESGQMSSGGGGDGGDGKGKAPKEGEKHSILVSPVGTVKKRKGEGDTEPRQQQNRRVDTPLAPLLVGRRRRHRRGSSGGRANGDGEGGGGSGSGSGTGSGSGSGSGGLFRKGSTASAASAASSKIKLRKKPSAWKRRFGAAATASTKERRSSASGGADENDAGEPAAGGAASKPAAWLSTSTSSLPDGAKDKNQHQQAQQQDRPHSQQAISRTASLLGLRNGGGNGNGQRESLTPPSRSSSLLRRDRERDREEGRTAAAGSRSGSRSRGPNEDKKKGDGGEGGGAQPVRSAEDATRDYMRRAWAEV